MKRKAQVAEIPA